MDAAAMRSIKPAVFTFMVANRGWQDLQKIHSEVAPGYNMWDVRYDVLDPMVDDGDIELLDCGGVYYRIPEAA
jgi:hypothetical protein